MLSTFQLPCTLIFLVNLPYVFVFSVISHFPDFGAYNSGSSRAGLLLPSYVLPLSHLGTEPGFRTACKESSVVRTVVATEDNYSHIVGA